MQCLILAGGPGTRMKPLTDERPKSLLTINGIPFAHYQLDWLCFQGIKRIVMCVGYKGEMIRNYVGDGERWNLSVKYSDEGDELLGTAGAIRKAIDEGLLDEVFLVLYGDSYLPTELHSVLAVAREKPLPMMCVFRNYGRWDSSNVVFEDGRVSLYEKGREDAEEIGMDYIDYGLSVMTREVITEMVSAGKKADLADVYHRLSVEGRLSGHEMFERFYEIGTPDGLMQFETGLYALGSEC